MKRFLSILLTLVLLLPSAVCFADGAETSKPINFSDFNFGDTFGSIRENKYCGSIEFVRGRFSARLLADAFQNIGRFAYGDDVKPWCFTARFDGLDKVAGYQANAELWFVYPVVDDAVVYNDADAVFYAGQYTFYQGDRKATYEDLKNKLAQVYGDAYYIGSDLNTVLGEVPIQESLFDTYNDEVNRMMPEYAVWKSSANNAYAVLTFYMQNGEEPFTRLVYISMEGEEHFAKMQEMRDAGAGNSGSDSLEGL